MRLFQKIILAVMIMLLFMACRVDVTNDNNIEVEEMETETYDYRDFSNIKVSGEVELYILQNDKYEIHATQSDNPDLKLYVKQDGNTLKVYTKNKKVINILKSYEKPVVYVSAPTITKIDGSGACAIHSENISNDEDMQIEISGASTAEFRTIKCNGMEIECSGASNISGKVIADKVDIDNSGASKTTLKVEGKTLKVDNGGASKSNIEFEGERVEIDNGGASNAKLIVNCDELSAENSGASKLTVSGKAGKTDINSSGASSVDTSELK